ncbi:hypothetical protein B0H14DRAFT_3450879 [Mycena olivaceomarginata]|nr:hypothetical protein B0H14DRAFT_3450879 [Mycena olivaceomarginata]
MPARLALAHPALPARCRTRAHQGAAPGVFGRLADAIVAIYLARGIGPIRKWVDDFSFFRYLNSTTSHFDYGLSEIYAVATELGWPWKLSKTQPFAHIYRYGSVLGKHESFHEAETVDGLSYLSLEVYEQLVPGRNIFQHIAPPDGRSSPALALFIHAPISELVYLLVGAAPGRKVIKTAPTRFPALDSGDADESLEEENEYEKPEQGSKKRKPKRPPWCGQEAPKVVKSRTAPKKESGTKGRGAGKGPRGEKLKK